MTATKALEWIGKTLFVRTDLGPIPCIIRDVREEWGRKRMLVEPIPATGPSIKPTWVDESRIPRSE